ncbi:MAG: hypothetical protein LUD02_11340 [Tannerellaceae bacterium]|nr:hypothetical protein [Tannerellaceae bacterium]
MNNKFTILTFLAILFTTVCCSSEKDTDNTISGEEERMKVDVDIFYIREGSITKFPIDEEEEIRLAIGDTLRFYIEEKEDYSIMTDGKLESIESDQEGYLQYQVVAKSIGLEEKYIGVMSKSGEQERLILPFYINVNTSYAVYYYFIHRLFIR